MLTNEQKTDIENFIIQYTVLNKEIDELQQRMKEVASQSNDLVKKIETLRDTEKNWTLENTKILGITEKEFHNLCLQYSQSNRH
jgi:prefoldin subunit 5